LVVDFNPQNDKKAHSATNIIPLDLQAGVLQETVPRRSAVVFSAVFGPE
jgi:hypothetical protein